MTTVHVTLHIQRHTLVNATLLRVSNDLWELRPAAAFSQEDLTSAMVWLDEPVRINLAIVDAPDHSTNNLTVWVKPVGLAPEHHRRVKEALAFEDYVRLRTWPGRTY